jgi:hypothetical protein
MPSEVFDNQKINLIPHKVALCWQSVGSTKKEFYCGEDNSEVKDILDPDHWIPSPSELRYSYPGYSKVGRISGSIFQFENLAVQLPCEENESEELENLISSSMWITELEDDWDDEGSQGYSRDTWERATKFLRKQVEVLKDDFCCIPVPFPQIAPADKGSIDLFWKLDDRQLLVNVPSDSSRLATYYGENANGESTSGKFSTSRRNFVLAAWLSCNV